MAGSIDKQLAVADVYAAALFDLARETQSLDVVRDELRELAQITASQHDFADFLTSRAITDEQRAAGLEKMFRGRLSDNVLNTLQVMNLNGRQDVIPALARCFEQRIAEAAGQVGLTVRSAAALDPAQQADIVSTAAKITGRKPVPQFRVEPELLGGLVIEFEDWRYDNSVRRQLEAAKRSLFERGERGLAVSTD